MSNDDYYAALGRANRRAMAMIPPVRRWPRKPRDPVRQGNPAPSTSDHVSNTIRYKARKDASKESSDVQSRAMFGRLASRKIEHARYRDLNKIRDEGSRVRLRKEHYKARQRAVERAFAKQGFRACLWIARWA